MNEKNLTLEQLISCIDICSMQGNRSCEDCPFHDLYDLVDTTCVDELLQEAKKMLLRLSGKEVVNVL